MKEFWPRYQEHGGRAAPKPSVNVTFTHGVLRIATNVYERCLQSFVLSKVDMNGFISKVI